MDASRYRQDTKTLHRLCNQMIWAYIFIKENVFGNVVSKIAAILSRPQCVNGYDILDIKCLPARVSEIAGSGDWFSLLCLVPWIKHLPHPLGSNFGKGSPNELFCKFDIVDKTCS